MLTKGQAAQLLADAHFRLDHGISRIFRLVGPHEPESSDPVKLLKSSGRHRELVTSFRAASRVRHGCPVQRSHAHIAKQLPIIVK